MTIPSKLNFLNEQEIDMSYIENESFINKLLEVSNNYVYKDIIDKLKMDLAGRDYLLSEKKYKGISYYSKRRIYVAEKTIKGVHYFIKNSTKFEVVEKAYLEFCSKHNIIPL